MKATGKRMQAEETNEEGLNNGNGSPKFIKLKPSPIIRKVSTEEGKEEEPEGRKRKLSLTSNPIMSSLEEGKKRLERSKRFGKLRPPTILGLASSAALPAEEINKRKQRALRFGIIDDIVETDKKKQRIQRFAETSKMNKKIDSNNKIWGKAIGQVRKNKKTEE